MSTQLQVVVDGRWLATECLYGDIEHSTVWPGGSDELSWSLGTLPARRFHGGEEVLGVYGGLPLWAGSLPEPDPSQDRIVAQGAWREAEGYAALDASGNASKLCDTAIDQAITDPDRKLRWTRPASIRSTGFGNNVDISTGPIMLSELLDHLEDVDGTRWGVNAYREVFKKADDTEPTYQTWTVNEGLGFALDAYASTLVGRYLDSGDSLYHTVIVTDDDAEENHGHKEQIVDLVTGRAAVSAATATTTLNNLLKLGKAIPQWTTPLTFSYGQILSMGSVPVALETVAAGVILRVHGGFELAQRLNGQMYLDVPIGRTQLAAGVLTVTPAQLADKTLTDVLTTALNKKAR